MASAGEALGVAGERSGAGEGAEEVGRVFVHETACGVVRIDDHLADGVDRKPVVGSVALPDRGDELDGLANVAEGLAAARFVEDGVDVGGQGRGLCGEENLAAGRGGETRAARLTAPPM